MNHLVMTSFMIIRLSLNLSAYIRDAYAARPLSSTDENPWVASTNRADLCLLRAGMYELPPCQF